MLKNKKATTKDTFKKASVVILSVIVLLVVLAVSLRNSHPQQKNVNENKDVWQIVKIGKINKEGIYRTSIAVDSKGGVHIVYCDGRLVYAYKFGNSWNISILSREGNNGYCAIAIDYNEHIHIIESNKNSLTYFYKGDGDNWKCMNISSEGQFGDVSIVVDYMNCPHIAYKWINTETYCESLKYAFKSSENIWNSYVVDKKPSEWGVGLFNDIGVDSKGGLHIIYIDTYINVSTKLIRNYLIYAYNLPEQNVWKNTTIAECGSGTIYSSLAIDSHNALHVCFTKTIEEGENDVRAVLQYAYKPYDGIWQISTVDSAGDVGGWCSIAVDAEDGIHISYYDYSHGSLKYAYKPKNGNWSITTVEDYPSAVSVGHHSSIAVDREGGIHIVYCDSTGAVKYAYKPPSKVFAKNIQKRAVDMYILSSYSYMNFACSARIIKFEEVLINEHARGL